jgi:hypothetical protein
MHTPITAFYAGLLGILFLYYSALVVKGRLGKKIPLGDGGDKHFQQLIHAYCTYLAFYCRSKPKSSYCFTFSGQCAVIWAVFTCLWYASPLGIKLAEGVRNIADFCLTVHVISDEHFNIIPLDRFIIQKKLRSLGAVILTHFYREGFEAYSLFSISLLPISIFLGFFDSGTTRSKSTCNKPFSKSAANTLTWSPN